MINIFNTVRNIVTGVGCFASLGECARGIGSKCLIVSGKGAMKKLGYIDRVEQMLNDEGISTCVLLGIGHDPDVSDIEAGRDLFLEKGCDMVLGIGGGSAIDAAKAIAKFAASEKPVLEFFESGELPEGGFPVIAIPSTFGTGTEVTRVSVLTDRSTKRKKGLRHASMLPVIALVDPELGMQVPALSAARSGLDAFTQAVESFFSKYATDITEALAFNAMVLISDGLPKVMKNPDDIDSRSNCANGSLMAGMAFSNSRLGIVHGMAHPLGARYGIEHGEVCGILLPHAMRYNKAVCEKKYALISGFLGMDAADWVTSKLQEFGLPINLRHLSIPADDFAQIAKETIPSGSTEANPRLVTEDDVIAILKEIC